jgi:hypothetical protein
MTDVVFDNGYEADAWREIRDWEQRPTPSSASCCATPASPSAGPPTRC